LSCYNCSNPVFAPALPGNYTFSVKIKSGSVLISECNINICVIDVRASFGNNPKIYLCHLPQGNPMNSQQLSISLNAVDAHLRNHSGDKLGICNESCGNNSKISYSKSISYPLASNEKNTASFSIFPNPINTTITITDKSTESKKIKINLLTIEGKILLNRYDVLTNSPINLNSKLETGVYLLEIIFDNRKETLKLIKL
jgi:Secretion system C-terminal sorting domain